MADPSCHSSDLDNKSLPAVKVQQETEVWRDVLDFKSQHQQQTTQKLETGDDSGDKPSGSWELVGSSHASDISSPARAVPGSEVGISLLSSGDADFTPAFQEAHAKALAEIEALEAAERATVMTAGPRGSTPLPVSTDAGQLRTLETQVLSGSSEAGSSPHVSYNRGAIEALGCDQRQQVSALADDLQQAVEICNVDELDGYSAAEDVQGLKAKHVKSEPESQAAILELQELCQDGSLDGSYWPECGSSKAHEEDKAAAHVPLQDAESFEDVKSAEGAFSEMSFDSPMGVKDASQRSVAVPEGSVSLGSAAPESQRGAPDVTNTATKVKPGLTDATGLAGGTFWLAPKLQQLVQRWTVMVMDRLPQTTVPQCLSAANVAAWKGIAYSASLALLSAVVVGLFVQNRKLSHEVRKKHEEVSRLMKALMNFQELWSSHRMGKAPILRHASFNHVTPHQPF